MKSITIHGLDEELDRRIRERAVAEGRSLNRTIKGLLAEALGMRPGRDRREEFADLFGSWSQAERREFERATEELRGVDPRDWQ